MIWGIPLLLTTLSTLVLELTLTRLFSVVLFYHYAFLVISMALLGLASGGVLARFLRRNLEPARHRRCLALLCLAAGVVLLPILYFVLGTSIWLVTTWEIFVRLAWLFLVCMIPFGLAGFTIASVMAAGTRQIASLYFFDLLGASLGCLIFVPMVGLLGAPNTVLAVSALWCVAGALWAAGARSRLIVRAGLLLTVIFAGLIYVNRDGRFLDVRYLRGNPRTEEVFSAWNSFSRISVVRRADGYYWIAIDGGAGTWIPNVDFEGGTGKQFVTVVGKTGPELAFWLSKRPRSLVIGPGGGFDVVRALAAGSPDVTAVEINPIIVRDLMQKRFLEYSCWLYSRPDVHVFVEDGRTFIERTDQRFDVIQLSQVDTWASSASGAYALSENYLYTVEAVESYLGRLTDNGILSIGRWEFTKPRETLRLVSVVMEALDRLKVPRPADHVVVTMEDMGTGGMQMGTVLVSRSPFTPSQIDALVMQARGTPIKFAYAPGVETHQQPFYDLIRSKDRSRFFASYEFNVAPVFDDSPFFFFSGRWSNFFRELFSYDPLGDSLNTGAQFLLLGLLLLALAAIAAFLIGPALVFRMAFPAERQFLPYLAYALAVGLAYILLEIALIQRFAVYLGQPAYSLTVVIFLLLLSSSIGSRLSRNFAPANLHRRAQLALAGIVALILAYVALIPWITLATQAQAGLWKVLMVALVVLPLGFLMGIPFPSGLRLTAESHPDFIEWAWALNAAATVLGSVLAVFVSVVLGITMATMAAAAAYAIAAWSAQFMRAPKRGTYDQRMPLYDENQRVTADL